MNLGSPQSILIKTYVHESGLWYLAQSLCKALEADGHQVRFIPKSKYIKVNQQYKKSYIQATEFSSKILPMSLDNSTSVQLLRYIFQHKVQTIISLETLMESSAWVGLLKRKTNVKIIDVPMLEWVTSSIFKQGEYNQFDKIWAVTNQTFDTFKKQYPITERVNWDFVDRDTFYYDQNPYGKPEFCFYHQGSLNTEYSSKNTHLVLAAFNKLNEEFPKEVRLIITGDVINSQGPSIISESGITIYDKKLSRQEIANIYSITDCVVAPSSKEGLGLSLFEAKACGCDLITTDAPPMNEHDTKYLCKVSNFKKDKTLVPIAELTVDSVYEQMKKIYEEKKTEEELCLKNLKKK